MRHIFHITGNPHISARSISGFRYVREFCSGCRKIIFFDKKRKYYGNRLTFVLLFNVVINFSYKEVNMRIELSQNELDERIKKNYDRFDDAYYRIEGVFQEHCAEWPGDKEGRALLAFVSHYKISGKKIPCMEKMLCMMPEKTNEYLYFDPAVSNVVNEQQLSGHSWLLRGLCEHYEQFGDDFSYKALKSITEHLFLPLIGKYSTYPVIRDGSDRGGVSGVSINTTEKWQLSSDTGCAFMSFDGLSHVYKITQDEKVKILLDEMLEKFSSMDKPAMMLQTHCTLTAARGMVRVYQINNDKKYLDEAVKIIDEYVNHGGMTYTYQNLNWWGRPDTWTEPCAIVDSLMLAGELYKITKNEEYRTLAARIFANGFATIQRPNGGAGTDTVVLPGQPLLYSQMYEAYFCCTMRLAEGLWYANENRGMLYTEETGKIERDSLGRYMNGDKMYTLLEGSASEKYIRGAVPVDGHKLVPIVKYYNITDDDMKNLTQRIIFDN